MSEWKGNILDKLCSKITDGSHYSPSESLSGKPMFSVKDMKNSGFDYSNPKRISVEDYEGLIKAGCQPQIDDILIAKDGSVMKHIFRVRKKPDYALLSSIAILRPDKTKIDPSFLVYSIKAPDVTDTILNNYVSGSGVPRIVLKDFKKIEIKFPALPEQCAIASSSPA